MIRRSYPLEVVAKWEGTHGFAQLVLRAPSVNGQPLDLARPWWVDRTNDGMPLTLNVDPDEARGVEVGTLFTVTLEDMTTVGDELERRGGPCADCGEPPEAHGDAPYHRSAHPWVYRGEAFGT